MEEGWKMHQLVLSEVDGMPLERAQQARGALGHHRARQLKQAVGGDGSGDGEPEADALAEADSDDEGEKGGKLQAHERWTRAMCRADVASIVADVLGPRGGEPTAGCAEAVHGAAAPSAWWTKPPGDLGLVELKRAATAAGPGPAWREEWKSLRLDQLVRQGQPHLCYPSRIEPGAPDCLEEMIARHQTEIRAMVRAGWERPVAEGYTLLLCACHAALAAAMRGEPSLSSNGERVIEVGASRALVTAALAAAAQLPPPSAKPIPPAYASLVGDFGLVHADPAWEALAECDVGTSIVTGAIAKALTDAEQFATNRGISVSVGQGAAREWSLAPSPVVRFVSLPRGEKNSSCRAMVHVGGHGYHLPEGAKVTVQRIDDRFKAGPHDVRARLITVHVEYTPSPLSTPSRDALAAATQLAAPGGAPLAVASQALSSVALAEAPPIPILPPSCEPCARELARAGRRADRGALCRDERCGVAAAGPDAPPVVACASTSSASTVAAGGGQCESGEWCARGDRHGGKVDKCKRAAAAPAPRKRRHGADAALAARSSVGPSPASSSAAALTGPSPVPRFEPGAAVETPPTTIVEVAALARASRGADSNGGKRGKKGKGKGAKAAGSSSVTAQAGPPADMEAAAEEALAAGRREASAHAGGGPRRQDETCSRDEPVLPVGWMGSDGRVILGADADTPSCEEAGMRSGTTSIAASLGGSPAQRDAALSLAPGSPRSS